MRKRFIWNFEIETGDLESQDPPTDGLADVHWEFRFFWKDQDIVTLSHLNDAFLNLAHYQIKYKSDTYYLLPKLNYNLKMRQDAFFYKPILGKKTHALAYGKKINLSSEENGLLPGIPNMNAKALREHIQVHGKKVSVHKEALIHRFDALPKTKFELAKLRIASDIYYSVSIESPSAQRVRFLTQQILGDRASSDYVTFLKGHASC